MRRPHLRHQRDARGPRPPALIHCSDGRSPPRPPRGCVVACPPRPLHRYGGEQRDLLHRGGAALRLKFAVARRKRWRLMGSGGNGVGSTLAAPSLLPLSSSSSGARDGPWAKRPRETRPTFFSAIATKISFFFAWSKNKFETKDLVLSTTRVTRLHLGTSWF